VIRRASLKAAAKDQALATVDSFLPHLDISIGSTQLGIYFMWHLSKGLRSEWETVKKAKRGEGGVLRPLKEVQVHIGGLELVERGDGLLEGWLKP
jgi:hypothetical protein